MRFTPLEIEEVNPFNRIMKYVVKTYPNAPQKVYLDEFQVGRQNYLYIVIIFKGGAKSVREVRSCSLNSIMELTFRMFNGGYYSEVDRYSQLKYAQNLEMEELFGTNKSVGKLPERENQI